MEDREQLSQRLGPVGVGLVADFILPIWWALFASIPLVFVSWWLAYRSGWFE